MTTTKELLETPSHLEASKAKLWELYKHWNISPYRSTDNQEDKDMLDFYESLCDFLGNQAIREKEEGDYKNQPKVQAPDEYFKQLVTAIKIILEPDRIYLFDLPAMDGSEEINRKEIYIMIRSTNAQVMEIYKGLLSFLALGKQELYIFPINRSYLKQELRNGNLFFQYFLNQDRLIYLREGSMELPIIEEETLKNAIWEARERILVGWETGDSFWEQVKVLRKQREWTLSAFFIHQALELWLRSLVHGWENHAKKTHEIRILLRTCRKYIPELAGVFPQDSPDEVKLLQTLEDAYCKARYQVNFVVEEEMANILFERAERIHQLCQSHHDKTLQPIFDRL
ncbi:HEPN domain-containing protein [Echinicola salinicaeni]|uniref:HEPN domain-containing protein n=1 Tax=Echinicola salinicaeni TaxID=2762757 RepID=UPI00164457B8|nr:HEPN domain-containing protein [Echinicola salinicaeni]